MTPEERARDAFEGFTESGMMNLDAVIICAEAIRAAILEEREACAKICADYRARLTGIDVSVAQACLANVEDLIRARST